MALKQSFLDELEALENFTATPSKPPWGDTKTLTSAPEKEGFFEGLEDYSVLGDFTDSPAKAMTATLWNNIGRGVWAGLDEATLGLLGWTADRTTGEPFEEAEGFAQKASEAVGTVIGFIGGGPMKLGKAAVGLAAKPFIKKGMGATARAAAKGTSKEYLEAGGKRLSDIGLTKEGTGFVADLTRSQKALARQGSWNKNVAENWTKHSADNIATNVKKAIHDGKITKEQARYIEDSFNKAMSEGRPMQDFIDVIMNKGVAKWGILPNTKEAFAIASVVQESVMFGAIDAVLEGVHSKKEERAYDWTAPLWGAGTGAAFGFLKFMDPAGKAAGMQNDFVAGLKGWFAWNNLSGNSYRKVLAKVSDLGSKLENSGESVIRTITHKGKKRQIDLLRPESSNTGFATEDEYKKILTNLFTREQRRIGKEMIGRSMSDEWESIAENWKKLVGGTIIMNARTMMAIGQGEDVPLEDIMINVLMGAGLNMRGMARTYDMQTHTMNNLRHQLDVFGIKQHNYMFKQQTAGKGRTEIINGLNHPVFEKANELALNEKILANEYGDTEIKPSGVTVGASTKDLSVFRNYHNWVDGIKGSKYLKPIDNISERTALKIQKELSKIEYDGRKIETTRDFNSIMTDIHGKITDRVNQEVGVSLQSVLREMGWQTDAMAPNGHIGPIPETVDINYENVTRKASKGEIEWLKNKKGEVMKGPEAEEALEIVLRKVKALIEAHNVERGGLPNADIQMGKNQSIDTPEQLREIRNILQNKEDMMNQGFNKRGEGNIFTFERMRDNGMLLAGTMRYMHQKIDHFDNVLDADLNPHSFSELVQILSKHGLVEKNQQTSGLSPKQGISILDRPASKIKVVGDGIVGDKEIARVKNALVNIIGMLGSKGQVGKHTATDVIEVPYSVANELSSFFKANGLPHNLHVFNGFAFDIQQRFARTAAEGSDLQMNHLEFLLENMNNENGIANYYGEGTNRGFSIRKLAVPSNANRKTKRMVAEFNQFVDEIIKAGTTQKDGKEYKVVVPGEDFMPATPDLIPELARMARRFSKKDSTGATETILGFINSIGRNHISYKQAIAEVLNTPGVSVDAVEAWLMKRGLIVESSKGSAKKKIVQYEYFGDKLDDKKIRREFDDFLKTRWNVDIENIEQLRLQNQRKAEQKLEQNRQARDDQPQTLQEFMSEYFPDRSGAGSSVNPGLMKTKLQEFIWKSDTDMTLNPKAVDDIIDASVHKVYTGKGEDISIEYISGKELRTRMKSDNSYKAIYNKAFKDALNQVKQISGSVEVGVIENVGGKLVLNKESKTKTGLDNFNQRVGINYFLIDGNMPTFSSFGKRIVESADNVFKLESSRISDKNYQQYKIMSKYFYNDLADIVLDLNIPGYDSSERGMGIIRMGNGKHAIGILKGDAYKIVNEFMDIYNKHYSKASQSQKTLLDRLKNDLLTNDRTLTEQIKVGSDGKFNAESGFVWSEQPGSVFEEAYRVTIIADMLSGKGSKFLESLDWTGGQTTKFLAKRFGLYDHKSMLKVEDSIIDLIRTSSLSKKDRTLAEEYQTRDFGIATWDDGQYGRIGQRIKDSLDRQNLNWKDIMEGVKDPSGFDSITFISEKMMKFLNLYSGLGGQDFSVFKPIISSQGGDNVVFYGKTVFVYDPLISGYDMQGKYNKKDDIWARNKNLDMITTASADKLELSPKMLKMSTDELLNIGSSDLTNATFKLPKSSVALLGAEKPKAAKNSYSLWGFTNNQESGRIFEHMYRNNIDGAMDLMKMVKENSMMESAMVNEMFKMGHEIRYEELSTSDAGSQLSLLMKANMLTEGEFRTSSFGGNMLMNLIKTRFLDPAMNPTADGYSGRGVMSQSLKLHRDLEVSYMDVNKDGKNVKGQTGQIVLPASAFEGSINFKNQNMTVKAIDTKNNKQIDARDAFIEMYKLDQESVGLKVSRKEAGNQFDQLTTLGELYDYFKLFDMGYDIGILTTRYPRTRPHDLTLLRLGGFLSEKHGNQIYVNDLDVFSRFEGDYDVDKGEYFWGHSRETFSHVERTKQFWFNHADVNRVLDAKASEGADLRVIDPTGSLNSSENWNKLDANMRVFEYAKGMSQKTFRLVQHMYESMAGSRSEKNPQRGRKLQEFPTPDGKTVKIYMDMGKEWYHRTALETQLLLDAIDVPGRDLVDSIMDWRNNYLFVQKGKESVDWKNVDEGYARNMANGRDNDPYKRRIQLFNKYVDGELQPLNKVEIRTLQMMLKRYSDFTALQTKIYTPGDNGKAARYEDMIRLSKEYFTYQENLGDNLFMSLRSEFGFKGNWVNYFHSMWGAESRNYSWVKHKLAQGQITKDQADSGSSDYSYLWRGGKDKHNSPFVEEVHTNGEAIAAGKRGSVVDRMYHRIWKSDPLKAQYEDYTFLTGNEMKMMDAGSSLMFENADWATTEMQKYVPKAFGDINKDVGTIIYYKKQWAKVKNDPRISKSVKEKRLIAINEIILEKQKALKGVISDQLLKGKAKDLKSFKDQIQFADIYRDADIREATIQLFTVNQYKQLMGGDISSKSGMRDYISEVKKFIREQFGEDRNMAFSGMFGHTTRLSAEQAESRINPAQNKWQLETEINELITRGYRDFGEGFLIEMMMPNHGQLNWGVYEGKIMPTAIRPSTNYRRVLKWMIDNSFRKPQNEQRLTPEQMDAIGGLTRHMLQTDSHFNSYFSRNMRYIPIGSSEVYAHFQSMPKMGGPLKAYIGRNYSDLKFAQTELQGHIFGLNNDFDSSLRIYRQIADQYGSTSSKYDKVTQGLSFLNQITMETGMMDPLSYMSLIESYRKELQDLGFMDNIKNGVDINDKTVGLNQLGQDPLMGLIMNNGGFSFNPLRLLNGYKANMLKKFLRQGTEVMETVPRDGNSWDHDWRMHKETGLCS